MRAGNLVDEGLDQFLLGPLTHVWHADDLDLVPVRRPGGDERADADDRVVDQLREVVTHRGPDIFGRPANQIVGAGVAVEVGYRFQIPDHDVTWQLFPFPIEFEFYDQGPVVFTDRLSGPITMTIYPHLVRSTVRLEVMKGIDSN